MPNEQREYMLDKWRRTKQAEWRTAKVAFIQGLLIGALLTMGGCVLLATVQ